MTIVEFIEARVLEDEQTARAAAASEDIFDGSGLASHPDWLVRDFGYEGISVWDGSYFTADDDDRETDLTRHMSRHDPARVLRQCAAMRNVVKQYRLLCPTQFNWPEGMLETLELNIRSLASIWSDHRDYREEWSR
ncbi:DUF6221 family protein [Nocardia wallacei]|uniref:DUF6221 family protein n=1 Tax=Nocardia wallacei TaxID=480035 RepID=UPI002454F9CD|nr:DUF6221 family protein [Nocardia wallacei]